MTLPAQQDEPVVTLAFTGGFRAPDPAGFKSSPFLRVFADGRVVTGQNSPTQKIYEQRLTPAEVAGLVEWILNQQKFTDCNSEQIARDIAQANHPVQIADAPTTEVTVQVGDRRHHVRVYASTFVVTQLRDVESVQQFGRIVARLQNLQAVTCLGGPEAASALLKKANAQLAKTHPQFLPATVNDIRSFSEYAQSQMLSIVTETYSMQLKQTNGQLEVSVNPLNPQ